jgi:glycosyltransferase involved in cell wall biosynthesis
MHKIVHIVYGNINSGAGKAVYALHNLLLESTEIESTLITTHGIADRNRNHYGLPLFYGLLLRIFSKITSKLRLKDIDVMLPIGTLFKLRFRKYDLVHIHSVNGILLSLLDLNTKKYMISIRDYWFFTGACHYPMSCMDYMTNCKSCHLPSGVFSSLERRWVRKSFERKKYYLSKAVKLHTITPGFSLGKDTRYVGNITDNLFYNLSVQQDRELRFLSGAQNLSDKNKAAMFNEIAKVISGDLNLFGRLGDYEIREPNFNLHGFLSPVELRDLYLKSKVFIMTSTQEMFGKTVLEALLCGCFIIGYAGCGYGYLIEQGFNGYLVKTKSEMLRLIKELDNDDLVVDSIAISQRANSKMSPNKIKKEYENMYMEVLA